MKNPVQFGIRDYAKVPRTVMTEPLDIIQMNYDGREIQIPAIMLLGIKLNDGEVINKYNIQNKDPDKEMQQFKYLNVNEQHNFLKAAVDNKKGAEKGKFAKSLRNNRNYLKLDSLFTIYSDFMNEELRDFLNCKEDGTENYNIEEVINGSGWFEYTSAKAACHQQKHLNTKTGKPLFNAKFGNKDGREVVFKADYSIVLDYPDKGTYNYIVPDGSIISKTSSLHKKYDVDPYYPLMEKKGYKSGLIPDTISWFGESLWNETSYISGYNTEVWDLLQDEKLYGDELMSKEEEFMFLKESNFYIQYKNTGFKETYKTYPQSYIDYFISESAKYE